MSRANGKAMNTYGGTTIPGAVDTADGVILHRIINTPVGQLRAPVRLVLGMRDSAGAPMPERNLDGCLVYALPGGGRVVLL